MMSQTPHVLVVDDDRDIQQLIKEYLEGEGFRVTAVSDGAQMYKALEQVQVQLVILDVRLPGESGFDLALQLRQSSEIPIIMLSEKDDVVDRVAGLEIGADDYVPKPFHLRELLARIRSLIRRSEIRANGTTMQDKDDGAALLRFSGWRLDTRRRELRSPAGGPVELTAAEFNLLLAFLEQPNRVLSRDELLETVHNREGSPYDRTIDVQVGRLRQKIEAEPKRPALIKTVRGAGYLFTAQVERG